MVTKMLSEIPILCFISVLLESSGRYGPTSEAFIFSLNNSEGLAPFLSKVKQGMAGRAIDRHSFYGPKFTGLDIVIYLDANTVRYSRAVLGSYYSVPASVKGRFAILKGPGCCFSPDEVEVFYLDPSRLNAR